MKSKHIILAVIIIIAGIATYRCYQFAQFFRFPGDRGEVYETWETANETFKVRITAYYEVGIYMPGAFWVCESGLVGSNGWREFKVFRLDDPIPILRERFRFVNEQTAYYYMADDFLVTVNGGRSWSNWKPFLPQYGNPRWGIREAHIEADGTGRAKLERYDERTDARVSIEVRTEDYGQSWSMIQNTAKHNKSFERSAG